MLADMLPRDAHHLAAAAMAGAPGATCLVVVRPCGIPRNALNYFEPYEALPPQHENQLTRALVVVLKLSVHAAWLCRVDPGLAS